MGREASEERDGKETHCLRASSVRLSLTLPRIAPSGPISKAFSSIITFDAHGLHREWESSTLSYSRSDSLKVSLLAAESQLVPDLLPSGLNLLPPLHPASLSRCKILSFKKERPTKHLYGDPSRLVTERFEVCGAASLLPSRAGFQGPALCIFGIIRSWLSVQKPSFYGRVYMGGGIRDNGMKTACHGMAW